MQPQAIPRELPEEQIDVEVLHLLLRDGPAVWHTDEVARELQRDHSVDALARLHGAGLIHRLDDFVFLTRAAARALELFEHHA